MNWTILRIQELCKVPQKGDPELEDLIGTQKNKSTLLCLVLMLLGRALRYFQMGMKTPELIFFLITVFLLTIFCLVCRRHRQIFNIGIAGIFGAVIFLNSVGKEGFQFANIESTLSLSFFLLGLSQSITISTLLFTFQFFAVHSKTREVMLEAIKQLPAEEILKVFMNIVNLYGPVIFLTTAYSHYALDSTTRQLVHSNSLANSALAQIKTFVQSFSHELRNPINSLLGSLSLLNEEEFKSAQKEMVTTAKICSELLLQLINNILDAGKMDLGALEIQRNPTDVYGLLQKFWACSAELIKSKKLACDLKIQKNVPRSLMIDPFRITQTLMNLISNACKFTDKGSIQTTIQWLENIEKVTDSCFEPQPYDEEDGIFEKSQKFFAREQFNILTIFKRKFSKLEFPDTPKTDEKGVLKIIIADTGIGMTPLGLSKLFKKFSQVSDDSSQRQIGTGLGLFITKEIISKMDGDIRAYSQMNQGSTFVICIPTFYSTGFGNMSVSDESLLYLQSLRLRCLVADDATFNLTLMKQYMSKLNADLIGLAETGSQAFEYFCNSHGMNKKTDLVITDLDMPNGNGFQLCRDIRNYEMIHNLKPVHIVIITGSDSSGNERTLLDPNGEFRANKFLKKPVTYEALMETLLSTFS